MAKTPPSESPVEPTDETSLEESFYEVPADGAEAPPRPPRAEPLPEAHPIAADEEPPAAARRFPSLKIALAVGAVVCVGAAVMAFRAAERRRAVREGLAQAEKLMRLDTVDAYRRAADLLAPHAQLDPLEAGSARAFALAMLAADYRDARAETEANALLVVPGRAEVIPRHASLAFAALALGKNVLGDATSALGNLRGNPWGNALQARIALRAGTLDAALEPAAAAAAEPGFVPGLAVHGDVARRAQHDARTARAAYEAALSASPGHPRAAFGLAKLALSGQAPESEASEALARVLAAGPANLGPERGRAALHLAALRLRAGDAPATIRAETGAAVGEGALEWLMGAARAEAANKGPYRAVTGAPSELESASDDDPPDLRPLAEAPPPPAPRKVEPAAVAPAPAHPKATAKAPANPAPKRSKAVPAKASRAKATVKKTSTAARVSSAAAAKTAAKAVAKPQPAKKKVPAAKKPQ